MDISLLQDYARLIVEAGVNPDKGQAVMVYAELDQPDFVRMVVKSLYEHGVSEVILRWEDSQCRRLDYTYVEEGILSKPKPWMAPRLEWQVENLPATLYLESTPPDIFDGLDSEKIARAEGAIRKFAKPFRDRREGKHQWCIATVPSIGWARKVFPGVSDSEAVERLWSAILAACYVDGKSVENWKRIQGNFDRRAGILNGHQFQSLHYQASNGTDFTIGLIPNSIFEGGESRDLSNRAFQANLPSEELFITPKKGVAEGLLVATRPLLTHTGALIDGFSIRFHEGKAVEWHAEKGQRDLNLLIATDEGAAYIALSSGMTIVPTAIIGSYKVFPHTQKLPQVRDRATGQRYRVTVCFCPEVETAGRSEREITEAVRRAIEERLSKGELQNREANSSWRVSIQFGKF